jgi:hypothetical protein
MNLDYIKKTLKNEFDNLIVKINSFCDKQDILSQILEENQKYENEINPRLLNFHSLLVQDNLYDLFLKSKIKLFSSKTEETNVLSSCLFGMDLTLKYVLNNRSTELKSIIWKYLHLFYFLIESSKKNNSKDRINKLSLLLSNNDEVDTNTKNTTNTTNTTDKNTTDTTDTNTTDTNTADANDISNKVKKDILKVDVNDTTNNLIDDIVKSFQDSLETNDSGNPFDCIMEITQQITEKYQNKIDNGEVELDKMMGSIGNTIPGMGNMFNKQEEKKEKVVIDENFSTDNVELGDKNANDKPSGFNLQGMMGMMNGMNGKNGGPNLKGLMDVMGKLNTIETEEDAERLKVEMDSYLENELGVDVTKLNDTIENIETSANINNVVNQVDMMNNANSLPEIVEVNESLESLD